MRATVPSVAEWRRLIESGLRTEAWLLAFSATSQAAANVFERERASADRHEDLVHETVLWLIAHAATSAYPTNSLSEYAATVLMKFARRERSAVRRELGRRAPLRELTRALKPQSVEVDCASPYIDSLALDDRPLTTAEREAGESCAAEGSVAGAARRLGISRAAVRSRLEHARKRHAAGRCPQASDRSWALHAAQDAEVRGRPHDAALLRDYAAGVGFSVLVTLHGGNENSLRQRVHRLRRKHRRT